MDPPSAGTVILIPFPFSDLTQAKLRPAVVLANAGRGDCILCQVTSNPYADPLAVVLDDSSFSQGSLHRRSYARPGKLFTASTQLIKAQAGRLKPEALKSITDTIVAMLQGAA